MFTFYFVGGQLATICVQTVDVEYGWSFADAIAVHGFRRCSRIRYHITRFIGGIAGRLGLVDRTSAYWEQ